MRRTNVQCYNFWTWTQSRRNRIFIQYDYNPNISNKNYFNALEREKAIAYGKQVALNRGDTNSIDGMGERDIIEVLMPEMVTRNPQREHGEGDSFMNLIEDVISNTDSSAEAGLLAAVYAQMKSIRNDNMLKP